MAMRGPKGDYLFKRPGSDNWYIGFKYPRDLQGELGKASVRSLGTSDRAEAERLAAPMVAAHKARIAEAEERRPKVDRRPRSVTIAMPNAADFSRISEIVRWIYDRQGSTRDVQVVELATLNVLFSDPDIAFEFKMRFG